MKMNVSVVWYRGGFNDRAFFLMSPRALSALCAKKDVQSTRWYFLTQSKQHLWINRKNNRLFKYVTYVEIIKSLPLKGVCPYLFKLRTPLHDRTLRLSRCVWGETAHSERTTRLAFFGRDYIKSSEAFKSVSSLSSTWYFIIEHFLSSLMWSWHAGRSSAALKFP